MIESNFIRYKGYLSINNNILLDNINLTIKSNKWSCIIGKSGSGKSTVLRTLAKLPISKDFNNQLNIKYNNKLKTKISWITQNPIILPWLNILDNVTIGYKFRKQKPSKEKALSLLKKVGLEEFSYKFPYVLSGGMLQKLILARTLMEDSDLILMDEPFSALDAITRENIQELTVKLLKNKTVVMVTHDILEALILSDNLYLLSGNIFTPIPVPNSKPLRKITPNMITSRKKILNKMQKAKAI